MVAYNGKYYMDIIERRPANANSIIETHCEVDLKSLKNLQLLVQAMHQPKVCAIRSTPPPLKKKSHAHTHSHIRVCSNRWVISVFPAIVMWVMSL